MKPILTSITTKLLYLFAFLIIVAALLVAATRFITPIIDTHKAELETWASAQIGMPIKIGGAELSWYQYQPVINLSNVTLFNPVTKQAALQIQSIRISFSIPQSLWEQRFIPTRITVSGTEVRLRQASDEEFIVQGFPAIPSAVSEPLEAETKLNDMIAWLSIQPRITLQNVDLYYEGLNKEPRHLTIYDLNLQNDGSTHILLGKGILRQRQATELTIAVQWEGKIFDLANIHANIYVHASGLQLAQWLHGMHWQGWEVKSGIGSVKFWGAWQGGEFKRIQSIFVLHQLNLYSEQNDAQQIINRISGNIGWRKNNGEYVVAGEDILIDLPNHLWPVTSFYASLQKINDSWHPHLLNIGYLDLSDVSSWIVSLPSIFSPAIVTAIQELKPSGHLYNFSLQLPSDGDWQKASFASNVSRVEILPWKNLPGLENFSAAIKWNGQTGSANIQSDRSSLTFPSIFANKISLNKMTGEVNWRRVRLQQ